jgi:cell wall assembly regulator SMI1
MSAELENIQASIKCIDFMKAFPLNCSDELSELTTEIKTATPERASEIIYRASYLFVFAGYGVAACEALSYLRSDNLCLNPYLIYEIKSCNSLVLNLCNALAIDSPKLSTQPSMSVEELSKLIHQQDRDCLESRLFLLENRLGGYTSLEMEACLRAQSDEEARDSLVKWWRQTQERCFHSIHQLIVSIPIMKALLSGVLQDDINISSKQVTEFIQSIRDYKYIPQPLFIPSPSDWRDLLKKWNDKIFLAPPEESDLESYAEWYPDEFTKKYCTKPPASEVDIKSLEERLGKQLPPSYRNFLLASNGWTFMEGYTLLNIQEVDWLNNLTPWLADWVGYEMSDEEYFYYGDLKYHSGIRPDYMKTVLQISNCEDGYVYLLNPLIVDERGEWECFDFGTKVSGGRRYQSFWDMIHRFYRDGID